MRKIFANRFLVIAVLAVFVISFLTFASSLKNELFFDDEELIYKNAYVLEGKISKFFSENMVAGRGKISNLYRPLLLISFSLDYKIWELKPFFFHLTNILIHSLTSVLVLILIYYLFQKVIPAFLASVLFSIHPVQTEAIAYVSGRTDPLYSFFFLLALITALYPVQKAQMFRFLLVIILFVFSLLSKETAIVFPAIFFAVLYYLRPDRLKKNLSLLIALSLVSLVYITLRLTSLNFANTLNFYQEGTSPTLLARLINFIYALFEYVKIIVFPLHLNFDRQLVITPLSFFVSLLFLSLILFFLIAFSLKNKSAGKIIYFSLLWFLILILPSSGIIPINAVIKEHYLYLPSLGSFVLLSFAVYFIFNKVGNRKIKSAILIILLFYASFLFIRTQIRILDWRSAISFYTASLKLSPRNAAMRNNLAMAYAEKGFFQKAIEEYQTAILANDSFPHTHHNLANVYRSKGEMENAETEYLKALEKDENFLPSLIALEELYQKTGQKNKLEIIRERIKNSPKYLIKN